MLKTAFWGGTEPNIPWFHLSQMRKQDLWRDSASATLERPNKQTPHVSPHARQQMTHDPKKQYYLPTLETAHKTRPPSSPSPAPSSPPCLPVQHCCLCDPQKCHTLWYRQQGTQAGNRPVQHKNLLQVTCRCSTRCLSFTRIIGNCTNESKDSLGN